VDFAGRYLPLVRHVVAHAAMDVRELLAALSAALPSSGEAIGPGQSSGLDASGGIKLGEDPMPSLAWLSGMSLLRVVRVAVHVHPLHRIRQAAMTLLRSLSHHTRDPDVREASGYGPSLSHSLAPLGTLR
jgi:ferric-dicitrate binding protein FerR (iron transport regulator)